MAEEYSNDRKRVRDRNALSSSTNATASDPTIAFGNANYWDPLSDAETNGYLNKPIDAAFNRYHDTKQRFSSAATGPSLQFHNADVVVGQSPKRSSTTATIVPETGSESSRSSVAGWSYRHPIIMQSIKSNNSATATATAANGSKRKNNNLAKASISPNLNVSFLTESERLAKTDLFLLPSDDSGGGSGHIYGGIGDTSPSADCSDLMQVCLMRTAICGVFFFCLLKHSRKAL